MSEEEYRRDMAIRLAGLYGLSVEETSPGEFWLFDKDGPLAQLPAECIPRVKAAMAWWARMLDSILETAPLNTKLLAENKSLRQRINAVKLALLTERDDKTM